MLFPPSVDRFKTAQTVKNDLTDVKAKITVVKRDWEKSGNGNGNFVGTHLIRGMEDADTDAGMEDTVCFVDDDRANFVARSGYGLPVLYFWAMAQKQARIFSVQLCPGCMKKRQLQWTASRGVLVTGLVLEGATNRLTQKNENKHDSEYDSSDEEPSSMEKIVVMRSHQAW
eukprot:scaffold644_cov32-Attheya_sp.AAC.1